MGGNEWFVAAFHADGALHWLVPLPVKSRHHWVYSIAETSRDVILNGRFTGSFSVGDQTVTSRAAAGFLAAVRPQDGRVQWLRAAAGPEGGALEEVVVDRDRLFVSGWAGGPLSFP